jgi:hypothetical protein
LHTLKQCIPSQFPYFSPFFAFRFRARWSPFSRLPPLGLLFFFVAGAVPSAPAVFGVAAADAADAVVFVAGAASDVTSDDAVTAAVATVVAAVTGGSVVAWNFY